MVSFNHKLLFLSLHSEHQRAVRPWYCCPESCGCPIPGGVQGQAGWGPGQPDLLSDLVSDLVVGNPAHGVCGGGVEPLRSLPTPPGHIRGYKFSCISSNDLLLTMDRPKYFSVCPEFSKSQPLGLWLRQLGRTPALSPAPALLPIRSNYSQLEKSNPQCQILQATLQI